MLQGFLHFRHTVRHLRGNLIKSRDLPVNGLSKLGSTLGRQ